MCILHADCGAIGDVQTPHKYTSTPDDTVAATLKGGCDLECDSYYKSYLYSALNASKITEDDIDTAISRVFTHFIALGELEGPDDVIFQVRQRSLSLFSSDSLSGRYETDRFAKTGLERT